MLAPLKHYFQKEIMASERIMSNNAIVVLIAFLIAFQADEPYKLAAVFIGFFGVLLHVFMQIKQIVHLFFEKGRSWRYMFLSPWATKGQLDWIIFINAIIASILWIAAYQLDKPYDTALFEFGAFLTVFLLVMLCLQFYDHFFNKNNPKRDQ